MVRSSAETPREARMIDVPLNDRKQAKPQVAMR
jgi:hypothetical protein